jgi:adenosylcobinamide-GDP ribazoletransferase
LAGAFRHFYLALNFLTVVPCPWSGWEEEKEKGALARAAAFFPLVGGLLGGILILLDRVLGLFLPSSVTAAAVLLALGLLTAGLHLDGLADTFDGLGAVLKHGREKALQAMRDKYCGPVGVSGLLLVLLFKYSLLASLPPELHPGGLLLMPAASRWLMVVAGWSFSYAHKVAGLGNEFIGRIGWRAAASGSSL